MLTKTAALEGADHNIRVNTIMPGPTQNTLLFDYLTGTNPSVRGDMESDVPLHRLGYSEDMAEAVVWLCSDAANFITGPVLWRSTGASRRAERGADMGRRRQAGGSHGTGTSAGDQDAGRNKEVVSRFYNDVFINHDMSRLDELHA